MNYRHAYMLIISRAKSEQSKGLRPKTTYQRKNFPNQYFEFHHILPKSLFPNWIKRKSNIVPLTAREHFFCHQLLTKIYPSYSMQRALTNFITRPNADYKICSKEYEKIKIEFSKAQSERSKNYWKSEEYVRKVMSWRKGYHHSEQTKKKISEAAKGHKKSEAHRLALKQHSHMRKIFTIIYENGGVRKFSKSLKDIAEEEFKTTQNEFVKASKYLDFKFGAVCLDKVNSNIVFDHWFANIKSKGKVFVNPLTGEPISPVALRILRQNRMEDFRNFPHHPWNLEFQKRIENLRKEIEQIKEIATEQNPIILKKQEYKEFFNVGNRR